MWQPSSSSSEAAGGLQTRAPTKALLVPTTSLSEEASLHGSNGAPAYNSRVASPARSSRSAAAGEEDEGMTRAFINHQPASAAAYSPSSSSSSSAYPSTLASSAHHRHSSAAAEKGKLPYLTFQYSTRIVLVMLPAFLIILVAGGRPLIAVLSVGALLAYALDAVGSPEASFVAVWLSLVAGMVSVTIWNTLKSYTMYSSLLLMIFNLLLFLLGVAISFHYRFLSREFLARNGSLGMMERVLFGAMYYPIVCVEILACFALGAEAAPWMLVAILAVNYAALLRPLPSSQQLCDLQLDRVTLAATSKAAKSSGKKALATPLPPILSLDHVVSPLTAGCFTFLNLGLPYWMYLALHHHRFMAAMFSTEGFMLIVAQILLLALLSHSPGEFFWFIGLDASSSWTFRLMVLGASAMGMIVLLELRVIIPVFGHFLYLHANWPILSFFVLTLGCLSGCGAAFLWTIGLEKSELRVKGFRTLVYVAAVCFGVTFGFPLYAYLPLLLLAHSLTSLCLHQSVLNFALAAVLWSAGMYLAVEHLVGFLERGVRAGGSSSRSGTQPYVFESQCRVLWMQATLAMAIPLGHLSVGQMVAKSSSLSGASSSSSSGNIGPFTPHHVSQFLSLLLDVLTCLYVIVLAALEWDWVRMDERGEFDGRVYAWYLVLLTSGLTILSAYHLSPRRRNKISHLTFVALVVLGVWKAGVLFFDDKWDMRTALMLVAAEVPIWIMYDSEVPHSAAAGAASSSSSILSDWFGSHRMTPCQALGHFVFLIVGCWFSKNTILAHILHWSGLADRMQVNESTYLGLFFLAVAVSTLPITFHHLRERADLKRWNVLGLVLSLLWWFLQPRCTFLSLASQSDVFDLGMEQVRPIWPEWVLFGAASGVILTVGTAAAGGGSGRSGSISHNLPIPKPLLALGLGSSLGIYLLGVFLPFQPMLYALMLATTNLAAVFVIYLFLGGRSSAHTPSASIVSAPASSFGGVLAIARGFFLGSSTESSSNHSALLTVSYCLFLTLLPLTYLTVGIAYPLRSTGAGGAAAGRGGSMQRSLVEVRTLYRVALLALHTALNILISLGISLHSDLLVQAMSKEARWKNMALYGMGAQAGGGGGGRKKDEALKFIGNLSIGVAFVTAVYLNLAYMQGSLWSIFAIAPILLLVQRNDDRHAPGLHSDDSARWTPVIAGVVGILFYLACLDLYLRPIFAFFGLVSPPSRTAVQFFSWTGVKNLVLLLMLLPSLQLILTAGAARRTSGFKLLLLAPLHLLPLLFTDFLSIQLLAIVGIVSIVNETWTMQVASKKGMRRI